MDSFFFKFKNLLSTGKSATLTFHGDAGKATITLAVEVEVEASQNVNQPKLARNSPSRQRRRERRAKARCDQAEKLEHEAEEKQYKSF